MPFGRIERAALPQPMSDINMTPLIDVMLVLLVIFIITAPLLATSLKLDLPRSDAGTPVQSPHVLQVAIAPSGELLIDEKPVPDAEFDARAAQAARANADTEVQLRADRQLPYGTVAELIGRLQKAGLNRIAFVTQAPP
jgi:biopolymer transport protein ExbD/biopolymer transport protein TolR